MTDLENKFMKKLEAEAFGGLIFVGDINPSGMNKAQKSGVVSSLVKKNIIVTETDFNGRNIGTIGIIPEGKTGWDAIWEVSKEDVTEAIKRAA